MTLSNTPLAQPVARTGHWRAATIFLLLLLALALTASVSMYQQFVAQLRDLQHKVQQTAPLQHVALLLDAKGEPAMLLTHGLGDDYLQLQRLTSLAEGPEDSMQLWIWEAGGKPHSLGVLTPKMQTLRLPLGSDDLRFGRQLGMSVEARGGSMSGRGPRLPYLLHGVLIQKAL